MWIYYFTYHIIMLLGMNLEWNLCSACNNQAFPWVTPGSDSFPTFCSLWTFLVQLKTNNCSVIFQYVGFKQQVHKPINGLPTSTLFTSKFSILLESIYTYIQFNSRIPSFRWSLKKLSRSFFHTSLIQSPAFRPPLPSCLFPSAVILLSSVFPVSEFSTASISWQSSFDCCPGSSILVRL